jgi:hypothetical protein
LAALNTKSTAADASLTAVNTALAAHTNAVNSREASFEHYQPVLARIANAAAACGLSSAVMDDIRSIIRKLRGARSKAAEPPVADNPATPEDESTTSHSSSQMSFDLRVEHFEKLLELLATQALYVPNENELKLAQLNTTLSKLRAETQAVADSYTPLSNARITRDTEMYHETTGLVTLALNVKNYIKSIFGTNSPQYHQVSGLKFTRRV